MNLSILFWNCQGVASPGFRRAFIIMNKIYNLDIVAILEPKISGVKADNFIKRSGFESSHRVEAESFAGVFGFYGKKNSGWSLFLITSSTFILKSHIFQVIGCGSLAFILALTQI